MGFPETCSRLCFPEMTCWRWGNGTVACALMAGLGILSLLLERLIWGRKPPLSLRGLLLIWSRQCFGIELLEPLRTHLVHDPAKLFDL